MRLADHPKLDALCGEWLLGTLRGGARRRFERALREEPQVAARLERWRRTFAVLPATAAPVSGAEQDRGWRRLERELALAAPASPAPVPVPVPWWRRTGFWQGWSAAATAAAVVLGVAVWRAQPSPEAPAAMRPLAELADTTTRRAVIAASLSADGRVLELRPARPIVAGPAQSYELWVIPPDGGAPESVAVLGDLSARIELAPAARDRLRPGATIAVSVEPAGGSPTGAPTGPVILAGPVGG